MCSIAGFCFTTSSTLNPRTLASALLCSGAERGDDACGVSYLDRDNRITTQTRAMTPQQFTDTVMNLPKRTRSAILHTRYATQGNPSNPLNNHPIERVTDSGQIVSLVHNGVIDNDNALFADHLLSRNAQVDSEIVPALLAQYGSESYASALSEISGSMALAWLDERTPGVMHLAKGDSSPIHFAYISTPPRQKGGSPRIQGVIFASTRSMVEAGLHALGLDGNSPHVQHYTFRTGEYTTLSAGEWDGLMYPWTPAQRTSYTDWNSPQGTLYPSSLYRGTPVYEPTFYGTPKASRGSRKDLTDFDLHMDYCTPTECEFYCDESCPARLSPGMTKEQVEYTLQADERLSDATIKEIVESWTSKR